MSEQKRVNSLAEVYGKLIGDGNCERQETEKLKKQNEWIWEYVLKNCHDFQVSAVLMEALPIPNTPMIKKLALLKLISLDVKEGKLSERDLFALQGYHDLIRLDRGEDDPDVLETKVAEVEMRVKAELALEHVRNENDDFASFRNAVERYWGDVVPDSQAAHVPNSLEEASNQIKSDMWSLKVNPRIKAYILGMYKPGRTQRLLKEFLELAWKRIGPVFLEKAEEDILSGRYVLDDKHHADEDVSDRKHKRERKQRPEEDILSGRYVPMDDKHHADEDVSDRKNKRVRKTLLASLDGEENPESRSDDSDSPRTIPPPWTDEEHTQEKRKLRRVCADEELGPAVERVFSELKQNQQDLKEKVSDPLPEAIEIAKKLREGTEDLPAPGDNADVQQDKAHPDENWSKTKFNVMERNPTARTCKWNEDDDIEMSPQETSPSASKRLNLSSANTKKLSPLNSTTLPRRRKAHKWTTKEEEALRRGVEEFGKGRWKLILQSNSEIFENRTEVDLKDKWRNIEKAEGIKRD